MGKRAALVAWFTGMAVVVGLTAWSGVDLVGHALTSIGAGVVLVVIVRAVAVAGAGAGWWLLFPEAERPQLRTCVLLRFIREATNAILPLAQIGGDFIGARCLTRYGVAGPLAAASVIVDVLVQAATQFLFAIVGVVLLLAMGGDAMVAQTAAVGMAVATPALAGFFLAQRQGGQRILKGVLARLDGAREWRAFGAIDELYARLNAFYGYPEGMATACVLHLVVWFVGATEVWIVLSFMGYAASFGEAVIIESLMHAVRGAAFVVPGALGVQEGGLIVLCAMFGLPPEAALALSLAKRIPDLVLGVPGLVTWQAIEGRHYLGVSRRPGT